VCRASQGANLVSFGGSERHDLATSMESTKLRLLGRAADLGDDGRGGPRYETEFQPRSMIGP
jgi:hypothetical protein